ncbi:hypothetical protein KV097_13205 [Mumia sp. zg.B17]|uniref:hypothetical protein n=1 Tax=Mumia sp. zg.B17 TaxID=2855446 RepID=UPI001C6F5510|nr:hypothetical protein [Mumia sp. zg.B17]MBW9206901.1 hypothetical protein [Mumia sp. zg.B17]
MSTIGASDVPGGIQTFAPLRPAVPEAVPRETRPYLAALAATATFVLGLNYRVGGFLPVALPLLLALAPLWLPQVRRYRGGPLVVFGGLLAVLSGYWLIRIVTGIDHELDERAGMATGLAYVVAFLGVGFLLWARSVLGVPATALAYALGVLASTAAFQAGATDNPWKFAYSWPVIVIVLAACALKRSHHAAVGLLLVLAAFSAASDARSLMGICLATAALVLWQRRPGAGSHALARRGSTLVLLAVMAYAGYSVVTSLLLGGALGDETRERTQAQIERSGNLLTGGRPEWSATIALMRDQPEGFGLGAVPNFHDVATAKTGLAPLNIPTIEGYVDNYMLGPQFTLHSVVADMWASLGVVGLVVALAVVCLLIGSLVRGITAREASALVVFLGLMGLWDLGFSSTFSVLVRLTLAIAVLLTVRAGSTAPWQESPQTSPSLEGGDDAAHVHR